MKILISGGTGLVGKELGKALVSKGHELFVLTRSPEKSKLNTPYPHTPIYWDATKNSPPSDVMSEMEGIINMAGVGIADKRWTSHYKNLLFNSRVVGTQNLVRAANEHGKNLKFFISTSAIGIYEPSLESPTGEDERASQSFLGKLCVAWESPIENFLDRDLRKVILRIGVVFSEKGGALEKMVPPVQMGFGGPLAGGRQLMSWIDIDDLVNMFIFATENEISGTYNAVAPNPTSNKDITAMVAERFGRKPGPSVPKLALKVAVGEFANSLVLSQNVSCEKIQSAGFKYQFQNPKDSLQARVPALQTSEKRHIFEQWIPKTPEEIFPFFADAKNLEQITPKSLNFKIEDCSTEDIQEGTIIRYKIGIHGIPMTWITKITTWNPSQQFVDNQEKGPYEKWHHTHDFSPLAGGTLMTDTVDSIVPMGRLGLLAAGWKVYGDVAKIFEFRKQTIFDLFCKD